MESQEEEFLEEKKEEIDSSQEKIKMGMIVRNLKRRVIAQKPEEYLRNKAQFKNSTTKISSYQTKISLLLQELNNRTLALRQSNSQRNQEQFDQERERNYDLSKIQVPSQNFCRQDENQIYITQPLEHKQTISSNKKNLELQNDKNLNEAGKTGETVRSYDLMQQMFKNSINESSEDF